MKSEHPPAWLDDAPEIRALLKRFLDRLDKKPAAQRRQPVAISVDVKTLPVLFSLGEVADQIWDFLRSLDGHYGILQITLKKQKDPFAPEYNQARLTLREGGEAVLRAWLQRPREPSPLQRWRQAVREQAGHFPGQVDRLAAKRIALPGLDEVTVVQGFVDIGRYRQQGLSLRQLSSRCFHGNSKFLDNREDLLRELYPDLKLSPRPVMVNVFLPASIKGVLFIENQDTYLQAVCGSLAGCENLALVYVAGFRGSAARIREPRGVSLHYQAGSILSGQARLEQWWFQAAATDWPLWFWGDLDYAGMAILKALKQRFAELEAWQPGYGPMLEILQQGRGHAAEKSGKQVQVDPGATGCSYADTVLLPAIRKTGAFVDQEAVP